MVDTQVEDSRNGVEKSLTLTSLSEAQARLLDLDIPQEDLQGILDGLQEQAKLKIMYIVGVMRELEAQYDATDAEIKRLQGRMTTRQGRIAWLRQYLQANMESLGIDRVESPVATVWLQRNPPSVEVVDEAAVPREWFRAMIVTLLSEVPEALLPAIKSTVIDAKAILELHKAGTGLPPGVKVVQDKRHLRIK